MTRIFDYEKNENSNPLWLAQPSFFRVVRIGARGLCRSMLYTNQYAKRYRKGMLRNFIYPLGQECPSKVYPGRDPDAPVHFQCGCRTHTNYFGIGTLGNQQRGRMSQDSVTKPCYLSECCTFSGPYVEPYPPLVGYIYYLCTSNGKFPGNKTASSLEPTGADCPIE